MKRIESGSYGGPDVMSLAERALPELQADRVRIKVRAAAINPLDWKIRRGELRFVTGRNFPQGMGSDFSGVVEQIGHKTRGFNVGDEVLGTVEIKHQGAFAEYVDADAKLLVHKPDNLSFSEAACIPIPAATAWSAIMDRINAGPGKHILINGSSGAVGRYAVQLALDSGARVTATCGDVSKSALTENGVAHCFSYGDPAIAAQGPYDGIFDTLGRLSVAEGLAMLKRGGRMVDINPTPGRMMRGYLSGRYKVTFSTSGYKKLDQIVQLAATGLLKPDIAFEAPFSDSVRVIKDTELGLMPKGRVVLLM